MIKSGFSFGAISRAVQADVMMTVPSDAAGYALRAFMHHFHLVHNHPGNWYLMGAILSLTGNGHGPYRTPCKPNSVSNLAFAS